MLTDNNQPAAIKFSLDETVWFRKGDEIEELYNLALEPNVTIQDLNHFISIRGSLKMYGEYKKSENEINDEEDHIYFSGQKYVTVLDAREEGISEFHFDFPVDITVPREKVSSIEDLDVLIEFFDYSIPDKDCLKLSTNVAITGIATDASAYERKDILLSNEDGTVAFSEERLADKNRIIPVSNDSFTEKNEDDSIFSVEAKKVEDRDEEPEENIQIPIQFAPTMDKLEKIEKKRIEAKQVNLSRDPNENQFATENLLVESERLDNEPEASQIIEDTEKATEAGRTEKESETILEASRAEEESKPILEVGHKAESEKAASVTETRGEEELKNDHLEEESGNKLENSYTIVEPEVEHMKEEQGKALHRMDGPLFTESSSKDYHRNDDQVFSDTEKAGNEIIENQEEVRILETKAMNTEEIAEKAFAASGERQKRDNILPSDNEPIEETKTRGQPNENEVVEASVQTIEEVQTEEADENDRTEKNINYQPQETDLEEKAISLTEFFGRKDENPMVRMKIYIVQERDTLNLIAEKYDVSISQLLRTNHLDSNQDVYEGQILYIPTNTHKIQSS